MVAQRRACRPWRSRAGRGRGTLGRPLRWMMESAVESWASRPLLVAASSDSAWTSRTQALTALSSSVSRLLIVCMCISSMRCITPLVMPSLVLC